MSRSSSRDTRTRKGRESAFNRRWDNAAGTRASRVEAAGLPYGNVQRAIEVSRLVLLLQNGGWHWRLVRQCPRALDVDRTVADEPPVPSGPTILR
jgi:hypothetical protein